MSKRARLFFQIGAWGLIATAAIHLLGHFAPQPEPSSDAERTLLDLMTNYRKDFGAGFSRSIDTLTASATSAASIPTSSCFLCCQSTRSGK